ncbi:MAG: ribbon-helix-helix domain-containing protein [Thermomicrobiales bacterium]
MTVTLTPRIEDQIRYWIESGQYPGADAVLSDALQLLEQRNQARYLKPRKLVRAGFESDNAGELTPDLMDEIKREAEEAFRRGEKPSPQVCP